MKKSRISGAKATVSRVARNKMTKQDFIKVETMKTAMIALYFGTVMLKLKPECTKKEATMPAYMTRGVSNLSNNENC